VVTLIQRQDIEFHAFLILSENIERHADESQHPQKPKGMPAFAGMTTQ